MIFMIFCVLFDAISGAFLCVPACFFWCGFPVFFVVLFLVSFGDFAGGIFCAFPGAFSTVFWCFFLCIFSCLSLFLSIYVSPWWWSCFFAVPFLVVFGCFFRVFFVFFFCVFFVPFIVFFFVHLFVLSRAYFRVKFLRALGGTQDKQPQYFAFWPVRFLVLFLVVTTSEDRKYTSHTLDSVWWTKSCISWYGDWLTHCNVFRPPIWCRLLSINRTSRSSI